MSDTNLGGARVLITRPAHQAEALCRLIEAAGGEPVRLPAIEIAGPPDPAALAALLATLDRFQLAIFVSPNAVRTALDAQHGTLPAALQLAAVGQGTVRALQAAGFTRILAPTERFDSEGLLALLPAERVTGQRIVIFRGSGGRELLGEELARRGAEVVYAECYRRVPPARPDAAALARLAHGEIDVAVVTSSEGLDNLLALAGESARGALLATPLVVVSERQVEAARARGFRNTITRAARASDADLLAALRVWRGT